MNPNKTVKCIAPFSSLYVIPDKKTFPCCVIKNEFDVPLELDQTLQSNFHKANNRYREQFKLYGTDFSKYKNCNACNTGDQKYTTQKDLHNDAINQEINYLENPTLTNLHIKFSNLCNLACRMCDSNSSNLLYKESKMPANPLLKMDNNMVIDSVSEDSIFYKSILENLDKIRFLWFSGGETFLHQQVWKILTHLYENNLSKNVVLQVNTNGTVKLSDKEISILQSFKLLKLHISMDGVGELSEYIRTNLNWNIWCNNFQNYIDSFKNLKNCEFAVMTAISTFNIHKFLDMKQYFTQKFDINPGASYVYGPRPETAAFNLSEKNKNYILNIYKDSDLFHSINNFLTTNPATMSSKNITSIIDQRDNIVLEEKLYKNFKPFREIEPEWYDRLKNF